MGHMLEIIPAILTNDINLVKLQLKMSEGLVSRVQIDITDGEFVNFKTVSLESFADIDTNLNLDMHLMVREPIHWIEKSIRAGADRIIGQIEMMNSQADFIGKVQEVGCSIGLGIDINTDIDEIDESVIRDIDVILLMSVAAGAGGQEFQKNVFDKIRLIARKKAEKGAKFKICVDGGVNLTNIKLLSSELISEVAVGSYLYNGDFETNLNSLKNEI